MNVRNTILLAVVLALLGSLFLFREKVEAPGEEEANTPKLTDFKAEDVVGVDIKKGDKTLVLDKRDDTWYVTKPHAALASRADMDALMSQIGQVKADRVLSEGVSKDGWKQYGLEKPATVFTVRMKDGAKHVLEIGDRSPNQNGWYVRLPEKADLYLSANTLTSAIIKPLDGWRDKAPFTVDLEKMDRVAVTGPRLDLRLEKAKDGDQWTMEKPKKGSADAGEIKKYVGKLKGIVVAQFFDKMKPDQVKPVYTVQLWEKEQRDPQTVIVGQAAPGGYYAVRGTSVKEVFLMPGSALADLAVDPAVLADRHLFALDPEKAARVDVELTGSGKASAEKKEGTWNFTSPTAKQDEMGKVTALTWSLKDVRFDRHLTDPKELAKARKTLASPYARVEVKDDKGKVLARLVVGGNGKAVGSHYVQGRDASGVYEAQVAFVDDWKAVLASLKEPAPSGSPAAGSPSPGP